MMKCGDAPAPRTVPGEAAERGWYYFWDVTRWQRERKEFKLAYNDLYHPPGRQTVDEVMGTPPA